MHRLRTLVVWVAVLIVAGIGSAMADEGMWPLFELNKIDLSALKARGMQLTPEQIFNEQDGGISAAVVQVGGGTGSFVSTDGLIITNHHVAFGAIQQQSSVDQNYLRDGFWARTRAEEIPAIGYQAFITKSFRDVTKEVLSAAKPGMSDLERYKAIDKKKSEIVKREEKAGGDVRCWVATFHSGLQHVLVTSFRIQDVRIVYIPPQAIGEFGGDIDNWMWPRHTGDFSFLRAYVAPDGKSATYSEQNVPYKSTTYLTISSAPRAEGDLTLMLGYPGGTYRYRDSYSINEHVNYNHPQTIKDFTELVALLEEAGRNDSTTALKVAGTIKGLNNALKNSQGVLRGLRRANLLDVKRKQDADLTAFIKADPARVKKYGDILPSIAVLYADLDNWREKQRLIGLLGFTDHYGLAQTLYKWSIEKAKPDAEREPGFMERNVANLKRNLEEAQYTLAPSADRRVLEYLTWRVIRLPAGQRIKGMDKNITLTAGSDTAAVINSFIANLFDHTKIGTAEERLKMFDMTTAQLMALNDPFLNLARDIYDDNEEIINRNKAFGGAVERLRPRYLAALLEWKQGSMYPDANGTIRLAYGDVEGYMPADAVTYKFITTLAGVIDKETGEEPFASPKALLDAYKSGDFGKYNDPSIGGVPVNFLTTDDGTGGNSGSPVMNGKGELIGLDFDSNWEGVAGDYFFDPPVKRSIVVDIRYVLYILDKVYHVQGLLDQLTIH
ncbi:MAG: S46 family peptidase [Candidatus Zixiibacteriota bacterium]